MEYTCEVKEMVAQPALCIRTTTSMQDLPQAIGMGYAEIAKYLAELGETPSGPPYVAYFNMDMEHLDVEMGLPVAKSLPGTGQIQMGEIPAGKYGSTLHIGAYSELAPAYDTLIAWMNEKGLKSSGVVYEAYLNDPSQTPPQELKTQILFLLKEG
jgi:effector-binding domain-containing protein